MINNKLLIISYYWPPSGGSGVQRWLNFSNSLIKKGWDITVFTAKDAKYPIVDNRLSYTIDKSIKVFKIPILEPTSFLKKDNTDNINSSSIFKRIILWIRANIFFPDS
ncbi:MAG: glycosyl transferase family 1, partial [Flavobacteriaceae bacterium]|nr:glycosyl transferase family 1 [Flavobacteriaceae bacterium]